MHWIEPKSLSDLFPVFGLLDQGQSVGLGSKALRPCLSTVEMQANSFGIQSSGSTGKRKTVWRPWAELRKEVSTSELVQGWTWASPYQPSSFAGVQVALQAWITKGKICSLPLSWEQRWGVLLKQRCDALSCTPTFLDLLLQTETEVGKRWRPKQITLGGEVIRPALGVRARSRFPDARFTTIYGSAEFGVLLKTNRLDGWYERVFLTKRYPQWRIRSGILELQEDGAWKTTGDQVEIQGELMRVVGRGDAVANVAGTKLSLAHIAALAEGVQGVRRAVAVAEPNAISGQTVCLKYAIDPDFDVQDVTKALQSFLRSELRKEAWPRRWELDEVGPVFNGKRSAR